MRQSIAAAVAAAAVDGVGDAVAVEWRASVALRVVPRFGTDSSTIAADNCRCPFRLPADRRASMSWKRVDWHGRSFAPNRYSAVDTTVATAGPTFALAPRVRAARPASRCSPATWSSADTMNGVHRCRPSEDCCLDASFRSPTTLGVSAGALPLLIYVYVRVYFSFLGYNNTSSCLNIDTEINTDLS